MNVLATPHLVKFYFVSFQTFLGTATKTKLHSFSTETTTTLRKVWFPYFCLVTYFFENELVYGSYSLVLLGCPLDK